MPERTKEHKIFQWTLGTGSRKDVTSERFQTVMSV
jgi:hypothetical protein